jgi:hypothetical protein
MRFLFCLLAAFFLALPAAQAQDAAQTQRLLQFAANNDDFDRIVSAQARDVFARQFPGCTPVLQVVRQLPQALSDLSFPAGTPQNLYPAPTGGLWIEHVKIRACDRVRQVNLLAIGQNTKKVLMLALIPGDTHADPAIQREAERVAAAVITKADATCVQTPVAKNTRFLGFRGADGSLHATDTDTGWFEEWDYRFCDRDVATQVAFIPGSNGALSIKARLPDAVVPQAPAPKPGPAAPVKAGAETTPPAE